MPQIVPLLVPKDKPLGKAGLIAQEVMAPEPVRVGVSGKSVLANPLVNVKFSGEYAIVGTSSTIVMLMYAVAVPPVLVPVMVNMLRVSNSVGVPLSTPVDVSNAKPLGTLGLMAQLTISPEPVTVGESGRSLLAVLLVKSKSFGE